MQVMRLIKHLYLTHMAGAKRLLGLRPHTLHALQLFYVRARGGGGRGGKLRLERPMRGHCVGLSARLCCPARHPGTR